VGSHAAALRRQGASEELVDAIGTDDFTHITVAAKDVALLKFVKLLTLTPAETKDADVQAMRDAGWTDEQIWEAALEVGIFSLLNRMADAHGLDYPSTGWYPPQLREKFEREQLDQENRDKQKEKEPPKAAP
jgi:alkylhydroperoxidase family enzyme